MDHKGIVVVVSGFSGAGKGTLMKRLVERYDCYALSVSMTTRPPREGERNGVEYYFVSQEEFKEEIANEGLIEYTCYCDNYYGTPRRYVEQMLEEGKNVILEIEVKGAHQILDQFEDALLLFIAPPSIEELRARLVSRDTESAEQISKRLVRAKEELECVDHYDYLIINDNLEEALEKVHNVISTEHMTPERRKGFIEKLRTELEEL